MKLLSLALSGAIALSLSTTAFAKDVRVAKIGHGVTEAAALHKGLTHFAELVEKKTDGSLKFQVFPNQQLGGDRELIEGLQFDSVDVTAVSGTNLAPFAKEFFAFDVFFLFDDFAHVDKTFDGEPGKKLLSYLEPIGIKGLGFMENGFRAITSSKGAVKTLDDLKGQKIRVAENPVQIAAWKALGANPTPMAWGELFTGLQQKTVDAQETSVELIESQRFYEVQKGMTISRHTYTPFVLMASKNFYDSLTPEQQKAVDEAAAESVPYQRKLARELDKSATETIKKAGLEVVELAPEVREEMRSRLKEANAMAKERAGEAYDILVNGAAAAK